MKLQDRVAVITGAGSGIGGALALSLARRGCHLALVDINQAGLQQTVQQTQALGVRVTAYTIDVTSREAVAALPGRVLADHGRIDLLVNNAGVATGGTFEQISETDFDWVMEVNFNAVVRLTRVFLPYLHRSDDARLVFLSSVFGLIAPAGQSAYSSSKFAVRGFANVLRHELRQTRIGVTVVHPGGVATAIARNARVPAAATKAEIQQEQARQARLLRMPPERAGELIAKGIENRKARLLVGRDALALFWLERLFPVRYWTILETFLRDR